MHMKSKFLLFEATQFVVICYNSPRKQIQDELLQNNRWKLLAHKEHFLDGTFYTRVSFPLDCRLEEISNIFLS